MPQAPGTGRARWAPDHSHYFSSSRVHRRRAARIANPDGGRTCISSNHAQPPSAVRRRCPCRAACGRRVCDRCPPPESIPAATAAENASSVSPALPQPDYPTFGQDAGSVLIGLTVRPALPGPNNTLDVRAASRRTGRCCGRPVEPGSAAAKHAADARLSLDGPPHRRGRVHKNRPRSTKVVRPGLGD